MNKRYVIFGIIVGFALAIGPVGWALSRQHKTAMPPSKITQAPILVQVAKVQLGQIPNQVSALGTLSAEQTVTISSESDGRIETIYFKNGQQVGKGMPIIQLADATVKAAYDKALTQLNLDRSKYQRAQRLPSGTLAKQEMESLKATVALDQAAVKTAQAALNQKQIEAPFSGTLGQFQVNAGDYVKAGVPIVTLVNNKQLRVDYTLDESLLPQVKLGQLVKLTVSAYPKQTFYGTVNFKSPTVNQATRSFAVEALVPNNKGELSPGMFAHVTQQINVVKNAILVPQQSVLADVKGYYVFKLAGNKVAQTYVKVGTRMGGVVQVLSGLKVGDRIVVAGQQKLQDGSLVHVVTSS